MIRARIFLFAAVVSGVPLAVACSSGPGVTGESDAGPGPTGSTTSTTTPPNPTVMPPTPGGCPDPGICGPGLFWNAYACRCEEGGPVPPPPPPPTGCFDAELPYCPPGTQWNPYACACDPVYYDAGPPQGCEIPGYGTCYAGETCVLAYCPNGGENVCYCDYSGSLSCSNACYVPDAGPPIWDAGPPIWDAGPPPPPPPIDAGPPDAAGGCYLPNYGFCPINTTCVVGYCPDGVTPVSCYCSNTLQTYCTGACTTPLPPDASFAE